MPPSQRPFMGATPYQDPAGNGVSFRIWTLFASAVSVAGSFNDWSPNENPLFSEDNGFWSVDVPNAQVGNQYLFYLQNPNTQNGWHPWHMDPYARQITRNGRGGLNGVIASITRRWPRSPDTVLRTGMKW